MVLTLISQSKLMTCGRKNFIQIENASWGGPGKEVLLTPSSTSFEIIEPTLRDLELGLL